MMVAAALWWSEERQGGCRPVGNESQTLNSRASSPPLVSAPVRALPSPAPALISGLPVRDLSLIKAPSLPTPARAPPDALGAHSAWPNSLLYLSSKTELDRASSPKPQTDATAHCLTLLSLKHSRTKELSAQHAKWVLEEDWKSQ
ncbi:hypothetical protein GUJ93_ZPchr0002g25929 [Zizania palustris]|uniref:Uncharacterized protein n=1 Tax=Zizania palustris TaxID=103762 RepID=A0A8J5SQJ7_ZIZPA|nr:hypothetical protein GUJ93_ZPchr0002g25929 [Zizania palustris]